LVSRHQYGFDISDENLERQMKGKGLNHGLNRGEDLPSFIDTILDNNGAMVSTVEKMRAGIPVGGMSPGGDMDTGGATYFFTRIKKLPGVGHLCADERVKGPWICRRGSAGVASRQSFVRM
jgi:hypothetical protein